MGGDTNPEAGVLVRKKKFGHRKTWEINTQRRTPGKDIIRS